MGSLTTRITPRRTSTESLPDLFRESSLMESPFFSDFWGAAPMSAWRSPFRELSRMQERMERMFNEMMSAFPVESAASNIQAFMPQWNVTREENRYLMSFELPGVRKEDIKLEISDNQLIVSGERKTEKHVAEEGYESREKMEGSFYRSFALPSEVEADKISAHYENGLLTLVLPRTGVESGRKIQISEAQPAAAATAKSASKVA
jgi:HSP20 family protein